MKLRDMRLKKALCTGIVMTSALVIVGCGGGDDDSVTTSNSQNYELEYTTYDIFTDVVDDKYRLAWGKLKYSLTNNGLKEEISTVVGSSPTAYQDSRNNDNDIEYYAGNNYFISAPEIFDNRYYKFNFIDDKSFRLKIQGENASISTVFDIFTYDLSGVKKLDNRAVVGIFTNLYYDYFPDDIAFPEGSKCSVWQETTEDSYYSFNNDGQTSQLTIDQWIENKQGSNYYELNDLVKENIGQNNSLPAVNFTDQNGHVYAAVLYNGVVYEADYVEQGVKEKLALDPKTGVVECFMYNDTAAEFMDEQIKVNYQNL